MSADLVVLVGGDRPLGRRLIEELVRQCAGAQWMRLGAADGRDPAPAAGSPLRCAPLVVLITWEDLAAEGVGGLARAVVHRIESFTRHGPHDGTATVCVVPYGAFGGARDGLDVFLSTGDGPARRPTSDALLDALAPVSRRVRGMRLLLAPMVVTVGTDGTPGCSLLQELVRTGRCLAHEVASKVPPYLAHYPLQFSAPAGLDPNVATVPQLVECVLDSSRAVPGAPDAPAVACIESLVPWTAIVGRLQSTSGLRLTVTGGESDLTAVDGLLNDLVWRNRDLQPDSRRVAPRNVCRIARHEPVLETLAQLAARPCAAWESSYAPDRTLDPVAAGLRETRIEIAPPAERPDPGAAAQLEYFVGGAGPAVVFVPPIGVEAGYFASLASELAADHRALIWQPRRTGAGRDRTWCRQDVSRHVGDIREMLAREHVERCHLVAWCGGVRLAARLAATHPAAVRSMSLLAPDICDADSQSEGYRAIARLCDLLNAHPDQAGQIIVQARRGFEEAPSANLDQYGARAVTKRSPLQYHPVGFWNRLPEYVLDDPERAVRWARESIDDRTDAASAADCLREYGGPILVVLGSHDSLIRAAAVKERCRGLRRWTAATLLGGNHYFLTEHGPAVAELLRRFMRDGGPGLQDPAAPRISRVRIEDPGAALPAGPAWPPCGRLPENGVGVC